MYIVRSMNENNFTAGVATSWGLELKGPRHNKG